LTQLYMQMGQQPPAPQDLFQNVAQLLRSQSYDVRTTEIDETSPIPEEAATLLILAPRDLTERQRYEINRFVQRGGNLVVATQNYEFNYTPARQGGFSFTPSPMESGIDPLLDAWGIRVSKSILMDANHEVLAVPSQRNIGGLRLQTSEPVQAPMQISVTADQMVAGTSISNGLTQLLYLWGSRLSFVEETLAEAELQHGVLFTTSSEVWEVPYTPGPLAMSALVSDPDSELSREPLGVMLRGQFPNLFTEGNVPSWSGAADSVLTPVEEFVPVESNVVVVGCAKMFEDSFLTMVPGNGLLLLNAVDALTLGDEIIQIRARTTTQRTIDQVGDGTKLALRFFVLGFVPLVVIAVGVIRWLRRKREEAAFLASHRPVQA
jgi:ABC-2 type transport system permease protein